MSTFAELYDRMNVALAEYSDMLSVPPEKTQYWKPEEKKAMLNEAYRKFCRDTDFKRKTEFLKVLFKDNNSFVIPNNIEKIISVKWRGRPLPQKSKHFLDARYSGSQQYEPKFGEGRSSRWDWRNLVGFPQSWYMDNGYIHTFPRAYHKPSDRDDRNRLYYYARSDESTNSNVVKFDKVFPTTSLDKIDFYVNGVLTIPSGISLTKDATNVTFASNSLNFPYNITAVIYNFGHTDKYVREYFCPKVGSKLVFDYAIPTKDKTYIDLYVNGVFIEPRYYGIHHLPEGKTSVDISGDYAGIDGTAIIVIQDIPQAVKKCAKTIAGSQVGTSSLTISVSNFPSSPDRTRVTYNGIVLRENIDFTMTYSTSSITINLLWTGGFISSGDEITVTVYKYDSTSIFDESYSDDLEMEYSYTPENMTSNTDVPDIPVTFHDCIWQYAVYLALMREGQATQDMQKASVYLQMYNESVKKAMTFFSEPVDIDWAMNQPFFV